MVRGLEMGGTGGEGVLIKLISWKSSLRNKSFLSHSDLVEKNMLSAPTQPLLSSILLSYSQLHMLQNYFLAAFSTDIDERDEKNVKSK